MPYHSHILPIRTRNNYSYYLCFHLHFNNFCAFPVEYPTVPKDQSRVRLAFHADNTVEQVDGLVAVICEWAEEMMRIEDRKNGDENIPRAARMVYSWMGGGRADH